MGPLIYSSMPTFPICPSPGSAAEISEHECNPPRNPKMQSPASDRNRRWKYRLLARPPRRERDQQVAEVDSPVAVEIGRALALVRDSVAVVVVAGALRDVIGVADPVVVAVVIADANEVDVLFAVEGRWPSSSRRRSTCLPRREW